MQVQLQLFAHAKQLVGADRITLDLPQPATVAQLRTAAAQQHPSLATLLHHTRFAVDQEYATDETPLQPNSEIACIPPVSGG